MAELRDQVEQFVKRVSELAEHVRGNEQATKQSLIGPFFTMLGYDLTDPRECIPEYKVDFGKGRSAKPIDWAFKNSGAFAFFVEAKEVGAKVTGYDEQLADYFAKDPDVKLGILTNGVHWRFFTDVVHPNVMDKEPFAKWDVANDDPPLDVIKLLAKSGFSADNIHTYAKRRRQQNLLVTELTRLLEPSAEFTKLAIENIETRNLVQSVVDSWKPTVASALNVWAAQRRLDEKLAAEESKPDTTGKIVTTPEELEAFSVIGKLLGKDRTIAFEDSVAYFKIHLAEKRTWVFTRLYLDRKQPLIAVPLAEAITTELSGGRPVASHGTWTTITLEHVGEIPKLGTLFEAAYDHVRNSRVAGGDDAAADTGEK